MFGKNSSAITRPIPGPVLIIVVLATLVFSVSPRASAQAINEDFWVVDGGAGTVDCIDTSNGTIYIGGSFFRVGPPSGGCVPFDATTGETIASFPKVTGGYGSVRVIVPDGAGGWYIGGWFESVGGLPRRNLAHVAADLSVSDWAPVVTGGVFDIALGGTTVYVGGNIYLVAFDALTGAQTSWDPDPDSNVYEVAVSGAIVYAGGGFSTIGGQPRSRIAALSAVTGEATAWDPGADSAVYVIEPRGSTVYVGGSFANIGGFPRSKLAELDASTGLATTWDPSLSDVSYHDVRDLAVGETVVYIGGDFNSVGGVSRHNVAAIDIATGAATSWIPERTTYVETIELAGDKLYVGSVFPLFDYSDHEFLTAFDVVTGAVADWSPPAPGGPIQSIAIAGNTVYVGGSFKTVGGLRRTGLAALDAVTGSATTWDPGISGVNEIIHDLAVIGNTVYLAGDFNDVGGQPRNWIAAVDAATGLPTAWNPDASMRVRCLEVSGSTVYAGGDFTSIGGESRNRIAALDAATGAATAWNPDADAIVRALAVSGSTVYAGGDFSSIGGAVRNYIGALDAGSGTADAWNPDADNSVRALAVNHGSVYAGGDFMNIGGVPRDYLAALDPATGVATDWDPDPNREVLALATTQYNVYVGGEFGFIGGAGHPYVAGISPWTGQATSWTPTQSEYVGGYIGAIGLAGDTVYVGGRFWYFGDSMQTGFAAIEMGLAATPETRTPSLSSLQLENLPNPFNPHTTIRFELPESNPFILSIYDTAGRLVQRIRGQGAEGSNSVRWDARGGTLASGVYIYRLEAGGVTETRRMVLIK